METSHPYELKETVVDDKGYFEAYASDFKDEPDDGGDVVMKGAFTESILHGGRNRSGIVMLWQHDFKQPLGIYHKIVEDDRGLFVGGQLALGTPTGDTAHVLMKMRAIKHMSYGYDVLETEDKLWKGNGKWDGKNARYLKKVDLWEISPVTFPMLIRTTITNVKAITEAKTERELEKALRESGFTKSEAMHVIGLCREALRESEKKDPVSFSNVLKTLQELNTSLSIQQAFIDVNPFYSISGMGVLPFEAQEKVDEGMNWSAGKEMSVADISDLKRMCAWHDVSNSETKTSYLLPHHTRKGYKVVWKGLVSSMEAFLSMKGAIPSEDRIGVYNHLVKHYAQFGKEPPKLK